MSQYVITLAQIKGGVAKTTSVINIGTALAESGKKVLLIDLDPQGSLSASFGIYPGTYQYDISSVLFDAKPLKRAVQQTDIDGLDIVPSSSRMAKEEISVSSINNHHNYRYPLKEIISRETSTLYDYVLLDCPSFLGVITMNALIASNLVIIPSPPEPLSLMGVKKMIDFSVFIKNSFNPLLQHKVLLTIYDERKKIYFDVAEKLKQIYAQRLFTTAISKDVNISKSQLVEKPILSYKSKSKASNQYRALAQEIIDYAQK